MFKRIYKEKVEKDNGKISFDPDILNMLYYDKKLKNA